MQTGHELLQNINFNHTVTHIYYRLQNRLEYLVNEYTV